MNPQEERGGEGGVAIADEGLDRRADRNQPEGLLLQQIGQGFPEGGLIGDDPGAVFSQLLPGLLQGEDAKDREEQPGRPATRNAVLQP